MQQPACFLSQPEPPLVPSVSSLWYAVIALILCAPMVSLILFVLRLQEAGVYNYHSTAASFLLGQLIVQGMSVDMLLVR